MDNNNKIKINFLSTNKLSINSWKIQDFINKLSNNYYKLVVLEEMRNYINLGGDISKIILFRKSFDFRKKYDFLEHGNELNLDLENNCKNFYHLGEFVNFLPSEEFDKLNLQFEMFRNIFKITRNKSNTLDKSFIYEIFNNNYIDDEKLFIERILAKVDYNESNVNMEYWNNIYLERLEEIHLKNNNLNTIKKKIMFDEINYNNYSSNYGDVFETFYSTFLALERPIIAIVDLETKKLNVLCSGFINNLDENPRKLNILSITHNSPTFFSFETVFIFSTAIAYIVKKIMNKKNYNELKKIAKNEFDELLDTLEFSNNSNDSDSVVDTVIDNLINDSNKRIYEAVSDNNFDNEKIEVSIIKNEK